MAAQNEVSDTWAGDQARSMRKQTCCVNFFLPQFFSMAVLSANNHAHTGAAVSSLSQFGAEIGIGPLW